MNIIIFWDHQSPEGFQLPVARMISNILGWPVSIKDNPVLIRGYDRARDQYDARRILDDFQHVYTRQNGTNLPLLLVIPHDIYIKGRDFVFGLARPPINAALISTARLNNGYYGKKHSDDDIIDRVVKEGAHEIGHLLGLDHCPDPECIMYYPQTLDELDRKKKSLCASCSALLDLQHDSQEGSKEQPSNS